MDVKFYGCSVLEIAWGLVNMQYREGIFKDSVKTALFCVDHIHFHPPVSFLLLEIFATKELLHSMFHIHVYCECRQ